MVTYNGREVQIVRELEPTEDERVLIYNTETKEEQIVNKSDLVTDAEVKSDE